MVRIIFFILRTLVKFNKITQDQAVEVLMERARANGLIETHGGDALTGLRKIGFASDVAVKIIEDQLRADIENDLFGKK